MVHLILQHVSKIGAEEGKVQYNPLFLFSVTMEDLSCCVMHQFGSGDVFLRIIGVGGD